MKKFIRTIWLDTEEEQIRMREHLNGLGFYVLSLPNRGLDVFVLEQPVFLEDIIVNLVNKLIKVVL